jgi:phenylacetic acid degradation operon negative regulatory protein
MAKALPILSTIRQAPISYFVYSSLSFFGRRRGGELPGMWFVRALREAGRDTAAVRQTLYRMEAEGELLSRKVGRAKLYRPTDFANAEIDAGLTRILEPPRHDWDGEWTIVHVHLRQSAQRVARERVVALLAVDGFALVGNDVYLHPRASGDRLAAALPPAVRPHVIIVRGRLVSEAATPAMVALWHIPRLAQRYRGVLARLQEVGTALDAGVSDRDAFLLRFALVFAYLGVAWDDPDLPPGVLPDDWPGPDARRLAARLYQRLVTPATRHADALLARSVPADVLSSR